MKSLLTFPKGGVHPPECKAQTEKNAIEVMPVPDEVAVILGQHIGAPCTPTVAKRDIVTEGAVIGEVKRGLGVPVHAPVSGKIKDISAVPHPVRGSVPAVIIKVDKEADAPEYAPADWQDLSTREPPPAISVLKAINRRPSPKCRRSLIKKVQKLPKSPFSRSR